MNNIVAVRISNDPVNIKIGRMNKMLSGSLYELNVLVTQLQFTDALYHLLYHAHCVLVDCEVHKISVHHRDEIDCMREGKE